MKQHYLRLAKQLESALNRTREIERTLDLAALHKHVVDLKTGLPETHSYEQSPLLLDGLRVHRPEDIPAYSARLSAMLETLATEYRRKAGL